MVVSAFARHDGQVTARQAGRRSLELAEMYSDFGIANPPWRHALARAHRIGMKALNGSYLRELRARSLRGTPLAGPDGATVTAAVQRLNPSVPVPSPTAG